MSTTPAAPAPAPDAARATPNGRSDVDKAKLTIPRALLFFLLLGLVSLYFLSRTFHIVLWAGVFWGLAMYATGVLGGFIFGIPRVLDRDGDSPPPPQRPADANAADAGAERVRGVGTAAGTPARRRSSINSNLVEVSDWLTKIIVGVGLVELKSLSTHGESLAAFIGRSIVPVASAAQPVLAAAATSIAGAIALYFGVLGFITGYLLTRIFLAVVMSLADRDVHAVETPMELPGGQRVPLQDLLEGFRASIADVQSRVAQMFNPGSATVAGPAAPAAVVTPGIAAPVPLGPQPAPAAMVGTVAPPAEHATTSARPRRVLWVDDSPNRNALLVARLREAGVPTDQVATGREALAALEREQYAIVVTDVVRRNEEAPESAGLRLIRSVRRLHGSGREHLPIVVFCSRSSEMRVREEALAIGADLVTSSQVDLWAQFTKQFGPM
jgi:CheY-like chemotaxis protein